MAIYKYVEAARSYVTQILFFQVTQLTRESGAIIFFGESGAS